jgi:eukaryotic-like serine/threonine-protein kinase
MALAPGTRTGPYEILGPIGAGGMGEVYRARDERLSRLVAIKVLPRSFVGDPERLRRFDQEARAAGQLNHPNIVVVYDTGTYDGAPYVVEELLEGETLRQRLHGGPLPARKAIDYARQVAQGLAAAHQKGIVHRDLKPENLFVTPDGRVKILDFGLAKLQRHEESVPSLTQAPTQAATSAGVVLGTVGYMSPEQVRGQPADHRADLFSFGAILYEMVTGRRPFEGPSSVETMNAILHAEPPSITQVSREAPAGLDRIIQHCLEKSPEERFQSARDLAFQLEALSSPSGSEAQAQAGAFAARGARAGVARPRWRIPAVVATLFAATAVAAFVAGRSTVPATEPAVYSQLTFRQGKILSARFTPDGETIVYSAAWNGAPSELFTSRPGSPESRPMDMPSAEILAISKTGEMAVLQDTHYTSGFMRSGTLAQAPLAGGAPRQVLEDVEDADWSPNGEGLAVVRRASGRYRLEFPVGKVLYETEAWISCPRFSRDGKRIAFLDHPGFGDSRGVVAVVDLAGTYKALTEAFSTSGGVAWSPGGEEVWFTASLTGNAQSIHAVDLAGRRRVIDSAPASLTLQDVAATGQVLLTRDIWRRGIAARAPGETSERDLSWHDWSRPGAISADGAWVLFEEQGQAGGPGYSVYERKTDGSPAVRIGTGASLGFSPDGKWALTTSLEQPNLLSFLPRGPGESHTREIPGFTIGGAGWFPDGRRMWIIAHEEKHLARAYLIESETGAPRPITPEGVALDSAASPDGRSFVIDFQGIPTIFPVDGGEPRPVPGANAEDVVAGWSTDGRSIFVWPRRASSYRIDRLDVQSGVRTEFARLMPEQSAGLVDIGFVIVSADARAYVYSYRQLLSTLYLVQGLR